MSNRLLPWGKRWSTLKPPSPTVFRALNGTARNKASPHLPTSIPCATSVSVYLILRLGFTTACPQPTPSTGMKTWKRDEGQFMKDGRCYLELCSALVGHPCTNSSDYSCEQMMCHPNGHSFYTLWLPLSEIRCVENNIHTH